MNIVFVDNFADVTHILDRIRKGDCSHTDMDESVNCDKCLYNDDQEFLVLMDIDETMITMRDKFLRPSASYMMKQIFNNIFRPITNPDNQIKLSKYIKQTEVILMDPTVPEIIKTLQKRGVKVIGFTRMIPGAGKCGEIESMEDNRRDELLNLGIDLRNDFLPDPFVIDLIEKDGRRPFYKDGIIYALPYTKGEVIRKILTHHFEHINIKHLYFVDDAKHHINDVAKVCEDLEIKHTCVHYVDAEISREKFDENFGIFQFKYFNQTGIWLNDSHYGEYITGNVHYQNILQESPTKYSKI